MSTCSVMEEDKDSSVASSYEPDTPEMIDEEVEPNKCEVTEEQEDEFNQYECSYLKDELMSYINEVGKSLATKTLLVERNSNADSHYPGVEEIAKRDSSVKKNSAFVKKLRNIGSIQVDTLLKECQSLNMSKYVSEAAVAIIEAKIKLTDIPAVVLLCTELNCTYPEFVGFFKGEYVKVLTVRKNQPVANANRLKVDLCFYTELFLCGVIPAREALPVLGAVLQTLTADKTFDTLNIILSFCKHCGRDFAGLVPRRIRLLLDKFGMTLNRSSLLMLSKQKSVKSLLCDYYASLLQHINSKQTKLCSYEKQNQQILEAKGELRAERNGAVEMMRNEIQSLISGAVTLAELLDLELPELYETALQDITISNSDEYTDTQDWEDEEERIFYKELPDVKSYLGQLQDKAEERDVSAKESDTFKMDDKQILDKKTALESFLKLLPECDTTDMIDNAALEFLLYFNTKPNCKKLVATLSMVPRNKRVLLPLYSRFTAIVNPIIPDVAEALCHRLKSQMLYHIHKKDQLKYESKNITMKFIGELVKFGLFDKKEALKSLRLLICNFTHHNIEMACSFLDTCGRVLYAASDTQLSTKYHLEQMMRLKTMMPLDARYITLIENTYYTVLPPESNSVSEAPDLTPMQQFIAKVIYQDMTVSNFEATVLHLRALNWDDEDVSSYTISCLTSAHNVKYVHIQTLANVVSLLSKDQEDATFRVVDGVLEDIRLGMEINGTSLNQRRLSMVKYLGEMYNYRLIDSLSILNVLYSLVSFEVMQDELDMSPLDPPTSVFRIHLVLTLLDTCAFPLGNLDLVKKLDYFFIYFQHYYWLKRSLPAWSRDQPFPIDIIHRFEDVLVFISPKFVLAKNFDEAIFAVNNLNAKIRSDAANGNPNLETVLEDSEESDDANDSFNDGNKSEEEMKVKENEDSEEEFLQEFNKVFLESVKATEGKQIKRNIDFSVPLNYKKAIKNDKQFVLLMKKGNKQTLKTLTLPHDHEYITSINSHKEAFRIEKEQFKKLTLDINERQQDSF